MHATGVRRRGEQTRWVLAVTVLGLSAAGYAEVPIVSALSASQRAGTQLVDITYTLAADTNCAVSVQISTNNGATYDLPAVSFSGDGVGAGVAPGASK